MGIASNHKVVRINLSEQTDLMDLLGTDLPVEGGKTGEFSWCNGVFLQALQEGNWVLLDELNLASQSVLEGLNSCLDHRNTIYISELDQYFHCPKQFRIFACQVINFYLYLYNILFRILSNKVEEGKDFPNLF